MKINKVTPVLIVEAIEPNLGFWTDQLGYTKTVEVPHGGKLGFVILVKEESEIMLQTVASVADDLPQLAGRTRAGDVTLYVEVPSLADAKRAVKGLEAAAPERTSSYGAKEIFVRTKDGHVFGFAEHAAHD